MTIEFEFAIGEKVTVDGVKKIFTISSAAFTTQNRYELEETKGWFEESVLNSAETI